MNIKEDVMNQISPHKHIACIPPTSLQKKIDPFDQLRPAVNQYLDYKISQTFAKLDGGDVKINLKTTQASYTPFPPEVLEEQKAKITKERLRQQRPPPKYTLDEKWMKKVELKQVYYKQRLAEIIKHKDTKNYAETKFAKYHKFTTSLSGPSWFVELSPQQKRLMENLEWAMAKDLKYLTLDNTKDILSQIGIHYMPKDRLIMTALHHSNNCPTEFLLVLYQISNPHRREYSINDRILLSGVVHLTITETLREMHIRVPSPPPPKARRPSKKPKPKKIIYKSPYLEKTIFKPRKAHSAIYKKRYNYKPRNPYFSYIPEMRRQILLKPFPPEINEDDEVQKEIDEEMTQAQEKYNSLIETSNPYYLLRPTVLEYLDNEIDFVQSSTLSSEIKHNSLADSHGTNTTLRLSQQKYDRNATKRSTDVEKLPENSKCDCNIQKGKKTFSETTGQDFSSSVWSNKASFKDDCMDLIPAKSKCACQANNEIKPSTPLIGGVYVSKSGTSVPLITGIRENKCACLERLYSKLNSLQTRKEELKFQIDNRIKEMSAIRESSSQIVFINTKDAVKDINRKFKRCRDILMSKRFKDDPPRFEVPPTIPEKMCKCKERILNWMKKQCQCSQCALLIQQQERLTYVVGQGKYNSAGDYVPQIQSVSNFVRTCTCLQKWEEQVADYEYKRELKRNRKALAYYKDMKPILGGVAVTPQGPVYIVSGVRPKYECRCRYLDLHDWEKTCKYEKQIVDDDYFVRLESRSLPSKPKKPDYRCKCSSQLEEFFGKQCTCEKCMEQLEKEQITYIMAGMKQMGSKELVPVLQGTLKAKTCCCLEEYKKKLHDFEYKQSAKTKRKQLRKQNYIIGGVIEGPSGPEYIVSGTKEIEKLYSESSYSTPSITKSKAEKELMRLCKCEDELKKFLSMRCRCQNCAGMNQDCSAGDKLCRADEYGCNCLDKYVKKLKDLEEYKKKKMAMLELKKHAKGFIIGGVTSTKDGPVFQLSGISVPQDRCTCGVEEEKKVFNVETEMHPLDIRTPYEIGAVTQTKQGKVFYVKGAKGIEDCSCMKLFTEFSEKHSGCIDAFEQYIKKMSQNIMEYMQELEERAFLDELREELEIVEEEIQKTMEIIEDYRKIAEAKPNAPILPPISFKKKTCTSRTLNTTNCTVRKRLSALNMEYTTCSGNKSSQQTTRKSKCSSKKSTRKSSISKVSSKHNKNFNKNKTTTTTNKSNAICKQKNGFGSGQKESFEDSLNEFKRFVILKTFPQETSNQEKLLKKILNDLAEDGFPIAKLPEAHKLPIFKLWLNLRSKKRWNKNDLLKMYEFSKMHIGGHVFNCYNLVEVPSLPLSSNEMKSLTYVHANTIRREIQHAKARFYRKSRQAVIENTRELFPFMMDYEFPYKSFRNTYFAYAPCKERDVVAFNISAFDD